MAKKQSTPVIIEHEVIEPYWTDWDPSSELRFVSRDERKILQQLWQRWFAFGNPDGPDPCEEEWRDVPLVADV